MAIDYFFKDYFVEQFWLARNLREAETSHVPSAPTRPGPPHPRGAFVKTGQPTGTRRDHPDADIHARADRLLCTLRVWTNVWQQVLTGDVNMRSILTVPKILWDFVFILPSQ